MLRRRIRIQPSSSRKTLRVECLKYPNHSRVVLRGASLRVPSLHPVKDGGFQVRLDQPQHAAVGDALAHLVEKLIVRDRVEVGLQVNVDRVPVAPLDQVVHSAQRVLAPLSGAKAVAVLGVFLLEDGLQHVTQRPLNDSVTNRGDTQRPLLRRPGLVDELPPNHLRPERVPAQVLVDVRQVLVASSLEFLNRHVIHARRPLVPRDPFKGRQQVGRCVDLVNQAEPNAALHALFEGRQHAVRPDRGFHPRPPAPDVSDLRRPCGHSRRFFLARPVHPASTFLRPFAPRA